MKKRYFSKWIMSLVVAAALAAIPAKADELYARIRGTVMDQSGASVSGAQIKATNEATGIARNFTSEGDGSYELISLPVGTYIVSASKNGFKKFETTGVVLTVNQIYVLNIHLSPGVVTELVKVEANPVQVETTQMQLGAVVSGQSILDLPLNGRDWIQLQQLQPGVVSQSDRRTDTYATNGSQAQQNSFLVNGADSNNFFGNTPAIIPSPDAIAEFRMVTNTLNPEYGRNSGAIVNAIIKSGSNQFHGSLFEFYRDTSLNATRWFLQQPDVLHRNQFGGTVGGPLWKDHTFFFLSYQGTRENRAENITDYGGSAPLGLVQVFTKAERAGDFSQGKAGCPFNPGAASPINLTDSNGVVQPAGTAYCTLWPNGIVPTADFSSVATNLVARYVPLPNSGVSGYSFNPIHTDSDDQGLFRIDHTLSPKDSLWGYGLVERTTGINDLPFFGATLPGFAGTADRNVYQFAAAWNHIFSATTLNEARISYTRTNTPFAFPIHPQLPSSLGFTGIIPQDPVHAGVPAIFVSGRFAMGDSPQGPEDEVGNTYQITDNLSRVSGRHSLKFGFAATRFEYNHLFEGTNNGDFSFSGAGAFSSGNPGLDFLLGIPDTYTQASANTARARGYEYYAFAQDQYRMRDNLTLTYGLGWQIDTPLSNLTNHARAINCFRPGEQSSVYPTAPAGLIFPGDPHCTASGYETHYGHVGPRVGFAWSPNAGWLSGGTGKLSVRGGFGIYFNRSEDQPVLQGVFDPPFSIFSFGIGAIGGSPSFAAPFTDVTGSSSIPNLFPYSVPSASNADFTLFEPLTLTVTDPRFTVPYAENYNLTLERELPAKTILSLGYVGAVGHHLLVERELNPGLNPQGCAVDPTCVQFRSIQQFFFPNNFRYPGDIFGSVGEQTTGADSNYNSFQASVRNSPYHGLQFSASYTWSHSLDIASHFEDTGLSTRALNPFDPHANYGDSVFDARQRFVAYYSYQIPGRKAGEGLVTLLTGGWEVSGITTLQTGFPITISSPGSFTSLTCTSFEFYGCWDVPNVSGPVQIYRNPRTSPNNLWFNPAAFSEPPFGVIGNARRNFFHGPGLNSTDLALHKWVPLGSNESRRLELRLEAFNIFNHAQFNNPDGSFTDGIPPNGTFGRVLSAGPPRLVQLAAKIYF